jgi:hypothetical protein
VKEHAAKVHVVCALSTHSGALATAAEEQLKVQTIPLILQATEK